MDNVDSITLQEEEMLHNMIMTEVHILRMQESIKEHVEAYRSSDEDDRRPPPQYLYKDLNDMENRYSKYQKELNVTREQRLKANREEKITITSMVSALQDAENKHKAGNTAGMMSYFTKKCKSDMSKMDFLLGAD